MIKEIMMNDTINRCILELENFSNSNGLDLQIDTLGSEGKIQICFTKVEDETIILDECYKFAQEVIAYILNKDKQLNCIDIDVSIEDDLDGDGITYVMFKIPMTEYTLEFFKVYVMLAHQVDSFISL